MTAAEDDKGMYNRAELFARLVFSMGGRAAEELVFGQPTTGASNDIEQATKIARAMITEYGMSPELGVVKYGEEQGDPFVGRGAGNQMDYSPAVAATIDEQTRYLMNKAHRRGIQHPPRQPRRAGQTRRETTGKGNVTTPRTWRFCSKGNAAARTCGSIPQRGNLLPCANRPANR